MMTVKIVRQESTDHGTFGVLTTDQGFTCVTGELPDRGNHPDTSCIPKGTYTVRWGHSPKYGHCYHVHGVEGRTDVLFHPANLMGDKENGYVTQLLGCIALGKAVATFEPHSVPHLNMTQSQKGIAQSKATVSEFVAHLGQDEFQLIIA